MLQDHGYGVNASPGVSVYVPGYAGTKYCCVREAHGCEQLAQSRYAATLGRGSNSRPLDRKSDVLPLCHDVTQWWLELLEIMDLSGSESSNSQNELASNLSWMITLGIIPCPQFSKQSSNFGVRRKHSKPSMTGCRQCDATLFLPNLFSFPAFSLSFSAP